MEQEQEQDKSQSFREGNGGEAGPGVSIARRTMPATRREFLTGGVAISALALAGLPRTAVGQGSGPTPSGGVTALREVGEIRSDGSKLRAFITVQSGYRTMPADPQLNTLAGRALVRYFEGKDPAGKIVWPPPAPSEPYPPVLPGPTLRAKVGDRVEITFLNHIHTDQFGATIDRGERGSGCDVHTDAATGAKIYPDNAGDMPPDCFHASTTVNMHFHGTHVTPDGLGDNVLLQLRPNPEITEEMVRADFAAIFAAGPPATWGELPETWRDTQLRLLKEYDETAVWQGERGTPGHPALPHDAQLLPQSKNAIARGEWPQYQIGAHPFCFDLPRYAEDADGKPTASVMGQCPGTHWYHAHKHGSTAINMYNGMAGVFVIEGDYDEELKRKYPTLREKVLIVQNLNEAPNLSNNQVRGLAPSLWVNGDLNPTISMRPGEIQLWRLVNASVRAVTTIVGFDQKSGMQIRQIAQDGVQFKFENYQKQPLLGAQQNNPRSINTFAAGNRVDILVKAPDNAPSSSPVFVLNGIVGPSGLGDVNLLTVNVEGEPSPSMEFPQTKDEYPKFPNFLKDIPASDIWISRRLDFGWEEGRLTTFLTPPAPKFMIDGKQFIDGLYNQTMVLGDAEEWTLTNSTARIAHPFHIHINPFQVVEVFDPNSGTTYKPDKDYIWQDVIAIPPAKVDDGGNLIIDNGRVAQPGHVKIRHRFVDFTGSYVLHCHMLTHEDRGMMQLVRVISPKTFVQHH
jgi:FtsP/CotA-like multicopper oxidase with cupredoxin domain